MHVSRRLQAWLSIVVTVVMLLGTVPATPTAAQSGADRVADSGGGGVGGGSTGPQRATGDGSAPMSEEQARVIAERTDRSNLPTPPLQPGPSTGSSAPLSPETVPPAGARGVSNDDNEEPQAPNDFRIFRSSVVQPAGSSRSSTSEPSLATRGQAVFYVGNWFAARSTDGLAFTHVNPATLFPSAANGFCCDQVVIRDPSRDITIWLLQYNTDANGNNVQRIAVSTGTNGYANNNWTYYDFTAQTFGFGNSNWLDFPHFGLSANSFYWTTNVFTGAGAYAGSVMNRIPLTDLQGQGFINWRYRWEDNTSATMTPAQTVGSGATTMYFARHINNTQLRVYTWPEAALDPSFVTVNHETFNSTTYTCNGPDGLNMCGRSSNRVRGGWLSGNELGFIWDAAQGQSGGFGNHNFPKPFIQGVIMNAATKAVSSQPTIWSETFAYQYPSVAPNSRGHLGLSLAYNSSTTDPGSLLGIRDDIETTFSLYVARNGTDGPGSNRWGDYLNVRPTSGNGTSWVASGFTLQGPCAVSNAHCANVEPRYYWFGRERDTPPGPPASKLAFGVQPGGARAGQPLSPQPTVRALDSNNNLVSSFTGSVTVAFGSNPGGATLNGTKTVNAVGGVATFSNLSVSAPGNGFTLVASSSGLTGATSSSFNITPLLRPRPDFDNDGKADMGVWTPSNGQFFALKSGGGTYVNAAGGIPHIPVAGDYDGDGIADSGVFSPNGAVWFIKKSTGGTTNVALGAAGASQVPVPADYDGDGKLDLAVRVPGNGFWLIQKSTGGYQSNIIGGPSAVPVPADYDADGKADMAVWTPSNGQFFVLLSGGGTINTLVGGGSQIPVPADYDGDGRADLAVFAPNGAVWFILKSTGGTTNTSLGAVGTFQVPVPTDYDGDGRADLGVWVPGNGFYLVQKSTGGYQSNIIGASSDIPLAKRPSYAIYPYGPESEEKQP